MVVVKDALNRIVQQVHETKPINVRDMVVVKDALNRIVQQVPPAKPINV
jgi:hypothetical protein